MTKDQILKLIEYISGFHPDVPHGAALIMISKAWYGFFAERIPDRFAAKGVACGGDDFAVALTRLQNDFAVDQLKMSDFGITREELPAIYFNWTGFL